ncbi:MAG: type VI secretion system contractile sheath small subunit [Pseudomonadota bacterium]
MADQSIAPKTRMNIKIDQNQGMSEQNELPLKMLMIGDYTKKDDDTPVQKREIVSVDKNNFKKVMSEMGLRLQVQVPDRLTGEEDREHAVNVKLESLDDFKPDNLIPQVAESVPELKQLVELRNALVALKGPLLETPEFRKRLQEIFSDESSRNRILEELDLRNK